MKQERFFHWKWLMFRSHNKLRTHPLIYSFTENDLEALWNRQNGLCALTDRPLSKIGDTAQLDHIIPLARGGTNELDNLRWVTSMANYVKHSLLDEELLLLAQDLIQKAKHPVLPPAREVDIKQTNSLGI
jgi:5-methylcytosine-specific restriction endonuclease McrA